ncbi:MAG: nifs1 [Parachlamydiales bacterium]|nr:nifs1 [Parachlamydiales bacterium]
MNESIYLDNHTATRPCQSALERMRLYLDELWGKNFDGPAQILFDLAGAMPEDQFVFASGGAEAIHQVFWSVDRAMRRTLGKSHYIAGCLEDAPVMENLQRLQEMGCGAQFAPVDSFGRIDLEKLRAMMTPDTALVSIGWAQALTGVIQPMEEIAKMCSEKNIYLHVDATYAVGKIPIEFLGDYLTFSGDRMHGLKSSGALFAKAGRPLFPLTPGADGVDIPALAALSAAAQQSLLTLDSMGLETARLRRRFEQGIVEKIEGAKILMSESLRLPNVSVIAFMRVHQEALLYALNRKKVFATIGGAPHQELAHLLMASGCDEKTVSSAISFSLSRMTTEAEIDAAVDRIARAFEAIHAIAGDLASC